MVSGQKQESNLEAPDKHDLSEDGKDSRVTEKVAVKTVQNRHFLNFSRIYLS